MFLENSVVIKLTTKDGASEISWSLGTACEMPVGSYEDDKEYTKTCTVLPGEYTLTCKDSGEDGWQGGFIEIQGTQYCRGFQSGFQETVQVTITPIGMHLNFWF